jgi:hypothetical protein
MAMMRAGPNHDRGVGGHPVIPLARENSIGTSRLQLRDSVYPSTGMLEGAGRPRIVGETPFRWDTVPQVRSNLLS